MDPLSKIVETVLYEGYVLWPYRRSASKNQQRWTFGGVYPRAFSETAGTGDPWRMRTECLVMGEAPTVTLELRFLQVTRRQVGRRDAGGTLTFVDELRVGGERHLAWDEATERELRTSDLRLGELTVPGRVEIDLPAGSVEQPLTDPDGREVGRLVRSWEALRGELVVKTQRLQDKLFKLTATVTNTTPWQGQDRESTLRQTFVSTHTVLRVCGGAFVSLTDPPQALRTFAEGCENLGTWPVLAGEPGDTHTLLSSPIILGDYPQIAPESSGDLFDGGEIDQLLLLNILALTDEEKAEMRDTDPRTRAILERSEALTADGFMSLHGAIRDFRVLSAEGDPDSWLAGLERPAPTSVLVGGVELRKGSRVRLRPRPGGDIFDLALAGKVAFIEAIEQDYEDRLHLSVTVEDDPGRQLGEERVLGHRFFFSPEEVEPLEGPDGQEP